MFVRLAVASITPLLRCFFGRVETPLVGQAYVLPQYVGRVGVERAGDEGDVLERGEGEVGDDELEQFAGKRFELGQ